MNVSSGILGDLGGFGLGIGYLTIRQENVRRPVMAGDANVVVVVMDTTRWDDAMDPSVAPTLTELGADGTAFRETISPAPWTLPAHASMVTGTYPSKHGAHAAHERLDDSLPTLPELFQDAGYETACVSNNTWLSIESGFDRGFDTFRQMWQLVQSSTAMGELVEVTEEGRAKAVGRKLLEGNPAANAANVLYRLLVRERSDDGASRTTEWIEQWLADRDRDEPFFLFTNYLEPHLEYRPPERLAEQFLPVEFSYQEAMEIPQEPWEYLAGHVRLTDAELRALRALYRAEIAYLDEQLAALKEALVQAGEWEDTILVITADHGENIGDHGMMDHQYCLYETLVHVPLVVHGGAFTDGGEVSDLVSLVDLAPTLLDAAGIDAPAARAGFQGRSFHPDAGSPPREFLVSEYMAPQPSMEALEHHVGALPDDIDRFDRSLRALRTDEHKLVRGSDGTIELYDLAADPHESTDVAAANPALVDSLTDTLDEWLDGFERADVDRSVELDADRKEHLEELGYIR
jgi:arylsulfatase A-like enzyme